MSRPVAGGPLWVVSMMSICAPLRLAEAAGVLSLATDLAMGQPLEHGIRTAVLAVRTAAAMGLSSTS